MSSNKKLGIVIKLSKASIETLSKLQQAAAQASESFAVAAEATAAALGVPLNEYSLNISDWTFNKIEKPEPKKEETPVLSTEDPDKKGMPPACKVRKPKRKKDKRKNKG